MTARPMARVLAPLLALTLAGCVDPTDLPAAGDDLELGRRLSVDMNCHSCHTVDGSDGVGPTWYGLYGSTETLSDGTLVTVDRAYLARSIERPSADIVNGFDLVEMPVPDLDADEVRQLVAYIESLGP